MEYEKIHACPNNCCLYRKEFANAIECPKCGQSRWKNVKDTNERRNQNPSKVIWYSLIIPQFKKLFKRKVQMKWIWIEPSCGRKLELTKKGSMTTTMFNKSSIKL